MQKHYKSFIIQLLASPLASDINFVEHIVEMLRQSTEKYFGKVDSEKIIKFAPLTNTTRNGKNICCLLDVDLIQFFTNI